MKRTSLRGKLLIVVSIPLIALVLFVVKGLWSNAEVLRSAVDIRTLSTMADQAGALIHELQAERGITAGYLASKGSEFGSALLAQRGRTDRVLKAYDAFMRDFDAKHFGEGFSRTVSGIDSRLAGLKDLRTRIDAQGISLKDATAFYTDVISQLLLSVNHVRLLTTDPGIMRRISAYEALLDGKEDAGQERAALNGAFVAHGFSNQSYRHFVTIAALEHAALGRFKSLASPSTLQEYSSVADTRPFQEVRRMRALAEESGPGSSSLDVKPTYWFNIASQRINTLKQVEDVATGEIVASADALYSSALRSFITMLAVSLIVVLVTLFLGWYLTRAIMRAINVLIEELYSGAGQTLTASRQVAQASQTLAEGASEQAASLEEISSTLEEMASMTRQNAERSQQVEVLSDGVNASAKQGVSAVTRMEAAINEIKESSDQTAKIIRTIDEIAFQTNLLALNAAVEAARAGDAGKGFAVVAEEVRNLAQRSAQAARSTSELIETSQQRAEAGVAVSLEVQAALGEVNDAINKVLPLIKDVSSASTEQSRGIDQATEALAQMDAVTQSTASNAEENSAASEELSAQAASLNAIVDSLLQLIFGHSRQRMKSADGESITQPDGPTAYAVSLPGGPGAGTGRRDRATESAKPRSGSNGDQPGQWRNLREKIEQEAFAAPRVTDLENLRDADFRDLA